MIEKLQHIQNEYGDLEIYEHNDWATLSKYKRITQPSVTKVYSQKWEDADNMSDELSDGDIATPDRELYDIDTTKPVSLGVLI